MIRQTSVTEQVRWAALGIAMVAALGTACSSPEATLPQRNDAPRVVEAVKPASTGNANVVAAAVAPSPQPGRAEKADTGAAPSAKVASSPKETSSPKAVSSLTVKRLVVTTGVKDREPVADSDALVANGSAIFALAELSNPLGESENVRITFERKGGAERVGNVVLPVPGQVVRHRTWAMTRFIRAAGVWDVVLWSESGAELGRTSFEVSAS